MRAHAAISEVAAVGVPAPGGGPEQLVLFLVLHQGGAASSSGAQEQDLKAACQRAIRSQLNPLFKLDRVIVRSGLPRTASNKVMRRVLRDELRKRPRARL